MSSDPCIVGPRSRRSVGSSLRTSQSAIISASCNPSIQSPNLRMYWSISRRPKRPSSKPLTCARRLHSASHSVLMRMTWSRARHAAAWSLIS